MTNKSFSELRKQSSNIEKLRKQVETSEGKKSFEDNRFWQAQLDKAGNGQADIRFLSRLTEDNNWVRVWSHGFEGPGGWFIENCPTTIGLPCPVCEDNGHLISSAANKEAGLEKVRARKSSRKVNYIANILVVNDPVNKENNGKVFLFKYGAKIHKKILDAITPPSELDEAFDPFHFDDGATFKLRISKVAGFANFDQSSFGARGPIKLDGKPLNEAKLEEIWKSEYDLNEFVDPTTKFKSYEDLEKRLTKALGPSKVSGKTIEESIEELNAIQPKSTSKSKTTDIDDEELETLSKNVKADADDVDSLRALLSD